MAGGSDVAIIVSRFMPNALLWETYWGVFYSISSMFGIWDCFSGVTTVC